MKIGFVGFGNMASAMADGWIAAGVSAGDMCACAGRYDALVERCQARGMAAAMMRQRLSPHPISWSLRSSRT